LISVSTFSTPAIYGTDGLKPRSEFIEVGQNAVSLALEFGNYMVTIPNNDGRKRAKMIGA